MQFTKRDVAEIIWAGWKDGARDLAANRFAQGVAFAVLVALSLWGLIALGR